MKTPKNLLTKNVNISRNVLMGALAFGVIFSGTHGGLSGGNHFAKSTDFHAKILDEAHTHGEIASTNVPIDPKALKNVRSDGNKNAEKHRENERNSWEVYLA